MAEVEAEEPHSNGAEPHDVEVASEAQTSAQVCLPCLIARGLMLAAATALLIYLVVQERKRNNDTSR